MKNLTFSLISLGCLLFWALLPCSWAEEIQENPIVDFSKDNGGEEYSYNMEGRTDPFRPFITPKAATPAGLDPNEIIDENKELTGLQLLEPGQLTLVGVLDDERGPLAMVEDQTKKGYILRQGISVGRRGVVTHIEGQQVIVTETSRTRAGKEINNTVIMRMNREGDK